MNTSATPTQAAAPRPGQAPGESPSPAYTPLAWARWSTKIPSHWRILRVDIKDRTGSITLGDRTQAIARIKWWHPPNADFDGHAWMARRLRTMQRKARAAEHAPAASSFDRTLWFPEAPTPKGGLISPTWYGYSSPARLLLEIVVNGAAGAEARAPVTEVLLPSLDTSGADAPTRWAVYDTSFESPSAYRIVESRLNLGGISLRLAKGKDRLLLGQVYPGTAALAKKPLEDWLGDPSPRGRWIAKTQGGPRPLRIGPIQGLERSGTKHLPFPLGPLIRRHFTAAVAHDSALDRILLVEHLGPHKKPEGLSLQLLESMNWARRERTQA